MYQSPHLRRLRNDLAALERLRAHADEAVVVVREGVGLAVVVVGAGHLGVAAAAIEAGKDIAATTDDYVQENPWSAIAISAGIGLLLGLAISRK